MNRIVTIPLAGLCALLCACSGRGTKTAQETEETVKQVKTTVAESQTVEQRATYTGTVEAEAVNNIAPQSPLRIDKIYVEVGDHVKRGQKLADMDSSTLSQARVQLENAEIEFRRADELYKIGGESRSNWDARKLNYDVARTNYENLLENTTLVSPVDGIVTARNYDNGDMHSTGTPVVVVEQIQPVKLTIHVSEGHFADIRKGMEVDIVTEAYGDRHFKGHVHLIYPTIDPSTRTFPVEVRLDNTDELVRPGMFARATLSFGQADRVVILDQAIVKQTGSGERYVYIVEDDKVRYSSVELGQRLGNRYEILSGIEPGDEVVLSGQSRLKKGDMVTTAN